MRTSETPLIPRTRVNKMPVRGVQGMKLQSSECTQRTGEQLVAGLAGPGIWRSTQPLLVVEGVSPSIATKRRLETATRIVAAIAMLVDRHAR